MFTFDEHVDVYEYAIGLIAQHVIAGDGESSGGNFFYPDETWWMKQFLRTNYMHCANKSECNANISVDGFM